MIKRVQELLGDGFVVKGTVIKKNNRIKNGILIRPAEMEDGPVFDVNDYNSPEELVRDFKENFFEMKEEVDFFKNLLRPIDKEVQEKISIRLTTDAEYASRFVHKKKADIFLIPCLKQGNAIANINPDILKIFGCSEDDLFDMAFFNMHKEAVVIGAKDAMLFGLFGTCENNLINTKERVDDFIVSITNKENNFGASCIFLKSVQECLNRQFPDGYYLIPSSVHECATRFAT